MLLSSTTPDICQFWYATALLRLIKVHQIRDKIANICQNWPTFCVLFATKYTSLKKLHYCWCWQCWLVPAMSSIWKLSCVKYLKVTFKGPSEAYIMARSSQFRRVPSNLDIYLLFNVKLIIISQKNSAKVSTSTDSACKSVTHIYW